MKLSFNFSDEACISGDYEARYTQWVDVFYKIAHSDGDVVIEDRAVTPLPLLQLAHTLGAKSLGGFYQVESRASLECICTYHTLLTDVLYRVDNVWKRPLDFPQKDEFRQIQISNYNSFWRKDFHTFNRRLEKWMGCTEDRDQDRYDIAMFVNCSADKPYPSPLHKHIKRVAEEKGMNIQLYVVTGALGVVPEGLWEYAPQYDAGIKNPWRVLKTMQKVVNVIKHKHVIVFTDFYNDAVNTALQGYDGFVYSPLGRGAYDTYLPLMEAEEYTTTLKATFDIIKVNQQKGDILP